MPKDVPPALSITGLRKVYRGGVTAVSNLDLELDDGAFFGLLGPNGAGKTTLIGAVSNVVRPSAGDLKVFGHDYRTREARRLIGLAEQDINVDRFLSVRQLLVYHAGYHGIGRRTAVRRADELLELFGLERKADGRAYELSGGMQRRLVLAPRLQNRPDRFYIVFSRQTLFYPVKQCLKRPESVSVDLNIVSSAIPLFQRFKHCSFPKNNV